ESIDELAIATRANGRAKRTIDSLRDKLNPLVDFLGDVPVHTVTVSDLRRYVADLFDKVAVYSNHPTHQEAERSLSPFTIAGRVRAFKQLFNWLEVEGIIKENPSRRIETPNPKRKEPKGISTEDFLTLLKTTEAGEVIDIRDRAIMMFLYDTGCRAGGLCGLRIEDLNFDELLATVTEKGNRTRLVPFSEPTAEALQDWFEVRPRDRGPWVFVGLAGHSKGALTPNSLCQMLTRRAADAGVTGPVNPHSFRHAFARNFLMDGGDLATLAKLLGNSIEVVVKYYAIFTVKELQKQHKKHSQLLKALGESDDGKDNGRESNDV
ncbi:MAG: tyrosine-type recombinase/integrase, partial [Anaerolineae bacterium]|nr:tyrosine-type recombinase/integrase [Anaerolineae bacterium]